MLTNLAVFDLLAQQKTPLIHPSKAVVEKLGGRMLSVYVTTGQYDVVVTVDMPNGETMVKYVRAIASTGNARTTTVRGYSPEEFSKLSAEAPSM
jgi:uncharacterized protein with GYD domain